MLASEAKKYVPCHEQHAFFTAERRRAVSGITLYALSAVVVAWSPVAALVIACVLPVFYGMTSTGWRFPRSSPRRLR